mmetsp:Transcript_165541/g.531237  ORF Transcript_165541/g.531237 Transcript_165541/m.531237 type:complete len:221 (-) Transcript_165541:1170-1832(-)
MRSPLPPPTAATTTTRPRSARAVALAAETGPTATVGARTRPDRPSDKPASQSFHIASGACPQLEAAPTSSRTAAEACSELGSGRGRHKRLRPPPGGPKVFRSAAPRKPETARAAAPPPLAPAPQAGPKVDRSSAPGRARHRRRRLRLRPPPRLLLASPIWAQPRPVPSLASGTPPPRPGRSGGSTRASRRARPRRGPLRAALWTAPRRSTNSGPATPGSA